MKRHAIIKEMRSKLLLFVLLLSSFCVKAQDIAVSSFKLLETDMDANLQGTRVVDQNGETAALIKIVTTEKGFGFSCGAIGIVKTVETPGEIWLYVPRGAQKITIKHPQLGVLRDWYFTTAIKGGRTYEMVLTTGRVETIVKKSRTTQYVVFNLTPKDAVVELNGEILHTVDGVATKMVKFGAYDYQIKAADHITSSGKVTVSDPNNKKVINISLKPNISEVSVKTDPNSEIWINGENKGKGTWGGKLGAGLYEMEAKREGYRSSPITKEIILSDTTISIVLDSPIPMYGEANVNSNPPNANVYIDGEEVAVTPQIISNLLIGKHNLQISKEGYEDYNDIIYVQENEELPISVNLNKKSFEDSSFNSSSGLNVVYFKLRETDFTAYRGATVRKNKFRKKCALIKIAIPDRNGKDFLFDAGSNDIVEKIVKDNEIWLYISPGSEKLSISHPKYGILKDYYYTLPIQEGCTYEMYLCNGNGRFIRIEPYVNQSRIFVDGIDVGYADLNEGGILTYLTYGTHEIKAINDFMTGTENLSISDDSFPYGDFGADGVFINMEVDKKNTPVSNSKQYDIDDLGIDFRPMPDSMKKKFGIDFGIEIIKVHDGLFKKAGVPDKCIIRYINDKPINSYEDLKNVVEEASKYKTFNLHIGAFNSKTKSNEAYIIYE